MLVRSILSLLLLLVAAVSDAWAQSGLSLLKDARPQISVLPLTSAQRNSALFTVKSLFDVYVNRQSKIDNYRREYPDIDPIPRIDALIANNSGLSNLEFHYKLVEIFLSLRDFHTLYFIPGTHGCFDFVQAVGFDLVNSTDILKIPRAVVKGFTKNPIIQQLAGIEKLRQISVGDELVSIDGVSLPKYVQDNKWITGGANNFGSQRSALASFMAVSGRIFPVPKTDEITFVFRSRANRTNYSLTLPWIAARRNSCFNEIIALPVAPAAEPVPIAATASAPEVADVAVASDAIGSASKSGSADIGQVAGSAPADPILTTFDDSQPPANFEPEPIPLEGSSLERRSESSVTFAKRSNGNKPVTAKDFGHLLGIAGGNSIDPDTKQRMRMIKDALQFRTGLNPMVELTNKMFPREQFSDLPLNPTSEPGISWGIYKPETLNLGVLQLEDFEPVSADPLQAFMLIRGLLVNELVDTKSIVIDIRSNGGGYISYADIVPQLFGIRFNTAGARSVISPVNTRTFNSSLYPPDAFRDEYLSTPPGRTFTDTTVFTSNHDAYQYGQAYFRAVGVFTNAVCYSACDLFAAHMQDNNISLIFGEDRATGGGGANVVELNSFLSQVNPDDFPLLPFADRLSSAAAPNLRVAWRQFVRIGRNFGRLIEDRGVISDLVLRPKPEDFLINQTTQSQYERISVRLASRNKKTGNTNLHFVCEPLIRDMPVGGPATFPMLVSGATRIDLLRADGLQRLGQLKIQTSSSRVRQNKTLTSYESVTKPSYVRFEFRGYRSDKKVIRTIRYVRFIPRVQDAFVLGNGTAFNWDYTLGSSVGIYNYRVTKVAEDTINPIGWNIVDNTTLRIGNGTVYANNLNTATSFFFTVDPAATSSVVRVQLKGTLDSEEGYDFFRVCFRSTQGTVTLVRESGSIGLDIDVTFDVPAPFFEVFVLFESDASVGGAGATVTSFKVGLTSP